MIFALNGKIIVEEEVPNCPSVCGTQPLYLINKYSSRRLAMKEIIQKFIVMLNEIGHESVVKLLLIVLIIWGIFGILLLLRPIILKAML